MAAVLQPEEHPDKILSTPGLQPSEALKISLAICSISHVPHFSASEEISSRVLQATIKVALHSPNPI